MKTTNKRNLLTICASALYVLSAGHPVLADDIETLVGINGGKPNVLFVMDTSGSMGTVDGNTLPDGTTDTRTRLEIVQDVFADLMNTQEYYGMNVALMRFDSGAQGGYFVAPMQELNATSNTSIITASNNFSAGGNTPLSETFYEAALFWSGMNVDYGDSSSPGTNHPDVFNGNHYVSPITSQCQKNYTILLTDGIPTSDTGANTNVQNNFNGGTACAGSGDGRCLDEIAKYLYTTDLSTGVNGLDGTQNVETYTIGFTTSQALLEATALEGGGTATAGGGNDHYIVANDATQLSAAFNKALSDVTKANNTFSPPAMAANSFNGVSHFNTLYYALFEPDLEPRWVGNVKPYTLSDTFVLEDADNNNATDANGIFTATSRSLWSNTADGGSILAGGANGKLPSAPTRNLYTYTGNYGAVDSKVLSDPVNALDSSVGSNLTPALMNLTDPSPTQLLADFNSVLDLTRSPLLGDPAVPTPHIGAPLHSQPELVIYRGTEAAPELTLFVATNDGFLHALDATTGAEEFAFIPQELLPNLPILTGVRAGTEPVVYGLDGGLTTWVKESNDADHTIESTEGDHVYVYVGMRRGGNNYYALDVTIKNAPVLKWVIKGGTGGTGGFEQLGQSWSKPTLTTIKYGSGTRKVLIFGGGYDDAQDANPLNNVSGAHDDVGRAIYIVDADDGSLLWYASPTVSPTASATATHLAMADLTHSIPSDVRLLDSDLDGSTDRLYVGDMRGQVLRFDFQATSTGMSGSGVVLARLGGVTEADNRRFFYPPDVVVTKNGHNAPYVSVNIGSGYRAHPLNPQNTDGTLKALVNDRFFSLRDRNLLSIPTTSPVITSYPRNVTDPADASNLIDSDNGWYISLDGTGEKVLAQSLTINSEIFFNTYTPPLTVPPGACKPDAGTAFQYRVSLFDGTPVLDRNGDGDTDDGDDRKKPLPPGIPPAPVPVFLEDKGIGECNGPECDPLPNAIQVQQTYWQDGS